jgi:hypothetical protein
MAKASTSTATWTQIDTASLPTPIAKQYARYKESYAEMKAERKAFEDAVTAMLTIPSGNRAVFGYNFGKLSVAIVDATAAPKSVSSAVSLASLIK